MKEFPFIPLRPLIIAELGTGHGGSPGKARELVDAAIEAGADCIKFQLVYADEILHPNSGIVPLPGGAIRLYDRFRELEVPLSFYGDLKEYIESRGKLFLCTPFGLRSARELTSLNPEMMKIASPELNHVQLLEVVASYRLPTILSSGVSLLSDIELALSYFADTPVSLLHCVTAYPAPEADYNLRILENLQRIFGVPVGVSDHSLDPVLVPALATLFGASIIEKHFCLSRSDPGLDDPIAQPPEDFSRMVRAVRQVQSHFTHSLPVGAGFPEIAEFMGTGEYLAIRDRVLGDFVGEYGSERISAILGDGSKRLAPSERANYERTNRSVHAVRDIQAGAIIRAEDVAVLRTEKVLRPGLHPRFLPAVVGRTARAFIPAGEGIRWEDL